MHALTLAAFLCAQPPDDALVWVKFDALTLKDAERLDGKTVATTYTVGPAPFTWGEGENLITVTAPANREGRMVILRGNRLHDADQRARATVVGTLRVIRHKSTKLGTMELGAWTEIRLEEKAVLGFVTALFLAAQPGDRPPTAIDLDALAVADARQFDGKRVVVQFTAAAPPYTFRTGGKLLTITGPAKDDAEWSVALAGNRLTDVGEGAELKVTGVLKVIEHPQAFVNGKLVPAWTEVRVTEG